MKKLIAGLLLILLILPIACMTVSATPSPTAAFYVNDMAGVLSAEQEKSMVSAAEQLAKQTGAQVVVLTVTTLDGKDITEYALEVARAWGIGDKEKNNGVLILLSTGDREVRVEVGYGLEGCLPDGKTGRLIDEYAIPYYAQNDFASGTVQLFHAVMNVVCEEYSVDPASLNVPVMDIPEEEEMTIFDLIVLLVAVAGMIALIVLTRGRILLFFGFGGFGRGGRGGGGGSHNFGGGGSFGGGGAGRRF